jgi:hypothetical protein
MTRTIAAVLLSASALCVSAYAQKIDKGMVTPAAPSPVSYGLVVDNSGSFRLLLDKVISVVADVIETQGPNDEAFLVTFVDTPKIALRQELTNRKTELNDAAQNMYIEGGQTAILDAVKSAADYLDENGSKEPGRLRSLVLVTDGDDRESKTKIEELLTLLRERKYSRVRDRDVRCADEYKAGRASVQGDGRLGLFTEEQGGVRNRGKGTVGCHAKQVMADTMVTETACDLCGAEIRDGSLYCYNCGNAVPERLVEPEPEPEKTEIAPAPERVNNRPPLRSAASLRKQRRAFNRQPARGQLGT